MKKLMLCCLLALVGCSRESEIASANLSVASDQFEINRRIIFYNGFTNDYMLSIEGLCSLGSAASSKGITVTCKVGPSSYKKHILGLSDNVTYFVEQIDPAPASVYQYRVIFKPLSVVPDIELHK